MCVSLCEEMLCGCCVGVSVVMWKNGVRSICVPLCVWSWAGADAGCFWVVLFEVGRVRSGVLGAEVVSAGSLACLRGSISVAMCLLRGCRMSEQSRWGVIRMLELSCIVR